jgi:hypothetical protein
MRTTDWKTKRITLSGTGGECRVTGRVLGDLAVHKTIGSSRGFTMTHVPTGFAVVSGLEESVLSRIAEELQPFDWSFRDPYGMPLEMLVEVKKIVEKHAGAPPPVKAQGM